MLPRLKPLAVKDRLSVLFIERGRLDVKDGAFVVIDAEGVRTHIPIGSVACLMLEPGARINHAAVALAARVGTLIVWVGEAGVRLYSAGQPGGAKAERLLHQVRTADDPRARLKVARRMYHLRFGEQPPEKRSLDQLRGMEAVRVRKIYRLLAGKFGVEWKHRRYNPAEWSSGDLPNRCLSAATACLYGLTEAAVLAAGYSPAVGFIHSGKPLSFVYDIADLFKFETVVPAAFKVAAENPAEVERAVRHACRDMFRRTKLLRRIIPTIEDVLKAGGLEPPPPPEGSIGPAIPERESIGDVGHRT